MSAGGQFAKCISVTALLLIRLSSAQNRVVFREDDDVDFEDRFLESPVKIPERFLMQLENVQNVSEFLRKFVKPEVPTVLDKGRRWKFSSKHGRTNVNSRRAPTRGTVSVPYAVQAKCEPELQAVEIEQVGGGTRLFWPSCVRVRRCGGCCSKIRTCTPIQTSQYNFTVVDTYYDPRVPDFLQKQGERVLSLEQHDKCECRCQKQPGSCGKLQEFHESDCRCICRNRDQASKCTDKLKVWDSFECACKCREMSDCSSGSYFNIDKCRCEPMKYYFPVSNGQENASIPAISKPQAVQT